jgi:hypothetical protein
MACKMGSSQYALVEELQVGEADLGEAVRDMAKLRCGVLSYR